MTDLTTNNPGPTAPAMDLISRAFAYLRHDTTTGIQLREMDALRGWACLGVIMVHCVLLLGNWDRLSVTLNPVAAAALQPLRVGGYGVDVFFFISGFLLHLRFAKSYLDGKPRPKLSGFYKRRLLRIAPAYYACVLIIASLGWLGVIESPSFTVRGAGDVLSHLGFIHNMFPEYLRSINGVFWTLAVELQFYIVLPFMAGWFHGRRWRFTLPIMLAAALGFKVYVYHAATGVFDPSGIALRDMLYGILGWRIEQFVVGMCFCELWLRLDRGLIRNPLDGRPYLADLLAVASAGLLMALLVAVNVGAASEASNVFIYFVIPLATVALTGLFFFGVLYGRIARLLFANRAIELLGIVSYSAYLWHLVVLVELTRGFKDMRGSMSLLQTGGIAAGALAAAFAVSVLSYVLFERPFLKMSFVSRLLYGVRE